MVPRRQPLVGTRISAATASSSRDSERSRSTEMGRDPGAFTRRSGTTGESKLDRGQQEGQRGGDIHAGLEPA
ncbi:hypothetical protein AYI68_g2736 [Smittium mucronatum]|uniref:Uncharacterized protein n=1 Tax=Smittium mucronatum TaxID=133383 RepID=A0A1R0H1W1_9FUNG|nr:hypothetical protein AYI68_g2736 [Smittium mucronatum]